MATSKVKAPVVSMEQFLAYTQAVDHLTDRLNAAGAMVKLQQLRIADLEARVFAAPTVAAAPTKIGNAAQWTAALGTLRARNVKPTGPRNLFTPEVVQAEMRRLFPELVIAPEQVLETRAPMVAVADEEDAFPDESMF